MYLTRSKRIQGRTDRGLSADKHGRTRGPKQGSPKRRLHKALDASAKAVQALAWEGYLSRKR